MVADPTTGESAFRAVLRPDVVAAAPRTHLQFTLDVSRNLHRREHLDSGRFALR